MAQVRITPTNQRRTLKTHGEVATCARTAILNLHGEVLLATLRQESRQLVVESLRLADASFLISLPILVEIARRPALGAQLLGSSWTETHPFSAFFLICTSRPSCPPAHPTLELHILNYPVVRISLDVNAMMVIVDSYAIKFSHFHHSTILGSLRCIWSVRFFVGIETTENVEASSKTREVGIYNRVPGKRISTLATDTDELKI
jgi:hypothetical protein